MDLKYLPLVLAAFSALRLAKFNLDERQHDSFIGLPTPAAAMICGSLATLVTVRPDCFLAHWCQGPVFIPVLTLILCYLLVCEIPMFSMKFGGGKKASKLEVAKRIAFLVIVGLAVIIALVERSHWSFIFDQFPGVHTYQSGDERLGRQKIADAKIRYTLCPRNGRGR